MNQLRKHKFLYIFGLIRFCVSFSFALQEPNTIDFEDIFYSGILRSSIENSLSDPNKESEYTLFHFREQNKIEIEDRALKAKQKYQNMLNQWFAPNLSAQEYQAAAYWILNHLELNNKEWLSFGTVLQRLGSPDNIYLVESGEPSGVKFSFVYDQKEVELHFSALGFVCSIMNNTSRIRLGLLSRSWPQRYYYSNEFPIVVNNVAETNKTDMRLKQLRTYSISVQEEWSNRVLEMDANNPLESPTCFSSKVMMIDVLNEDLACIFFEIQYDSSILYKHIWSIFQDNKRVRVSDDEAIEILLKNSRQQQPIRAMEKMTEDLSN